MKLSFYKSLLILVLFTTSCANLFDDGKPKVRPIDYIEGAKKFNFQDFFDGSVDGFSIVKDQNDNIIDTKKVFVDGSWEGNKGVVKHRYEGNKIKSDSRTWLVTMHKDGTFDAVGHDIAAPASGEQVANAAQMTYTLRLKDGDVRQNVFFEDRIYMVDEDSVIIITNFAKESPSSDPQVTDNKGQIITSLFKVYVNEDDNNK